MGLLAEVTLPEKLKDQKLVNEVSVTTTETGERKVTSKTEIEVYRTAETPTPEPEAVSDEGAPKPECREKRAGSFHASKNRGSHEACLVAHDDPRFPSRGWLGAAAGCETSK